MLLCVFDGRKLKSTRKINCTWPFNNSEKNDTCIDPFELNEIFKRTTIHWIVAILNAFFSFTTLFGNTAILLTIWNSSSLHSVANILLASLAVSDLAVGSIVQPSFAVYVLTRNNISRQLCNISGSFLGCASFVTITAIIADRILVIQLHLRYHEVGTSFRVILVVIFIWVLSGVRTLLRELLSNLNLQIFKTVELVIIISLLVGNSAVYLKNYLIVRRHQRQIQHQQQQQQLANNGNIFSVTRFKKTALNAFIVYILLLFCFMPYCFALLDGGMSPRVYTITLTLVFLNSSLTSCLYC